MYDFDYDYLFDCDYLFGKKIYVQKKCTTWMLLKK